MTTKPKPAATADLIDRLNADAEWLEDFYDLEGDSDQRARRDLLEEAAREIGRLRKALGTDANSHY